MKPVLTIITTLEDDLYFSRVKFDRFLYGEHDFMGLLHNLRTKSLKRGHNTRVYATAETGETQ